MTMNMSNTKTNTKTKSKRQSESQSVSQNSKVRQNWEKNKLNEWLLIRFNFKFKS